MALLVFQRLTLGLILSTVALGYGILIVAERAFQIVRAGFA